MFNFKNMRYLGILNFNIKADNLLFITTQREVKSNISSALTKQINRNVYKKLYLIKLNICIPPIFTKF